MSTSLVLIDAFSLCYVITGALMTVDQPLIRRLFHQRALDSDDEDALTYGLRVAGTMMMAFGAALGILFTPFLI